MITKRKNFKVRLLDDLSLRLEKVPQEFMWLDDGPGLVKRIIDLILEREMSADIYMTLHLKGKEPEPECNKPEPKVKEEHIIYKGKLGIPEQDKPESITQEAQDSLRNVIHKRFPCIKLEGYPSREATEEALERAVLLVCNIQVLQELVRFIAALDIKDLEIKEIVLSLESWD
ncbi:MAG: hypothetical protein JW839_16910 [Candidatus Lokiarchaeota archaeon]|nr:hypothetical protein [Candidatus Lokiarchaeota archaeon]